MCKCTCVCAPIEESENRNVHRFLYSDQSGDSRKNRAGWSLKEVRGRATGFYQRTVIKRERGSLLPEV